MHYFTLEQREFLQRQTTPFATRCCACQADFEGKRRPVKAA